MGWWRSYYAQQAVTYKQFNWLRQNSRTKKVIDDTRRRFHLIWRKPTYYLIEWYIVKDLWETCEIRCINTVTKEVKQCMILKKLLHLDNNINESIYLI